MNVILFIQKLEHASTQKELEQQLENYLSTFGFKYYAFTYYDHHIKTGLKLHYSFASKLLQSWHRHYLDHHYADSDRTLESYYMKGLPEFWDVEQQLEQAKSGRERQITRTAVP